MHALSVGAGADAVSDQADTLKGTVKGSKRGGLKGTVEQFSGRYPVGRIELDLPGRSEQYRVSGVTIVKPEDVSVLDPTPEATLTLVTCYPFYFVGSAPELFIVKATRVAAGQ